MGDGGGRAPSALYRDMAALPTVPHTPSESGGSILQHTQGGGPRTAAGRSPVPLLWLVHFNCFFEFMESPPGSRRPSTPGELVHGICLIYADDVTFAYAHERPGRLVELANGGDRQAREAMTELSLQLELERRNNMVLSPGEMIGGVFRRNNGLSRTVNKELATRGRRLGGLLATIAEDQLPCGVLPAALRGQTPRENAFSF